MRYYLIDEISHADMEKINDFLNQAAIRSELEKLFWVKIPEDLLSEAQFQHIQCGPHVFAVELGTDWIKIEFFIRNLKDLQCTCQDYCTSQQRDFLINFVQKMIEDLGIRT